MTKIVSRNRARAPVHDRFTAQILDHDQEHEAGHGLAILTNLGLD